MKFDTVIIGGGLTGLSAGILLAEKGRKVAIVSSGQSALHFNSGGFGLLGYTKEGKPIANPLEEIALLPEDHPYSKVGIAEVSRIARETPEFFSRAGLTMNGKETENRWRLTPLGIWKPCWLSMLDFAVTDNTKDCGYGNTLIVNLEGFLDFYPDFLKRGLELSGSKCYNRVIGTPELEKLRKSSTEMRAANIARIFDDAAMKRMADTINGLVDDLEKNGEKVDTILMPSVAGLYSEEPEVKLRNLLKRPLALISTQPMSVGGMRMQMLLRKRFQDLGGTFLPGDTVTGGDFADDELLRLYTVNLGDMTLEAPQFILATGSFFSHGLQATPDAIKEPVFSLDVNAPAMRADWYSNDLYCAHPYMKAGVKNDTEFRVSKDNRTIRNLRAAGSIAGGADSLKEESGAGVGLITALHVAELVERDLKKTPVEKDFVGSDQLKDQTTD